MVYSIDKKAPARNVPLAVYSAYARDTAVRWNATSGGVVSTLVRHLLKDGSYTKAYVVKYDKYDGTQAKLMAITDPEEMLAAAKSKYIPVSVEEVVKAVRANAIDGSIVVCTPCQQKAIRKVMASCVVSDAKVLFIGLFCQSMFSYDVYARYEKDYGSYEKLYFRDKEPNGWPADTTLVQNGVIRKVDRKVRTGFKKEYTMPCCLRCVEKLNEDADISVGDCYVSGFSMPDGVGGVSTVVIRTGKGRAVFEKCRDDFVVEETPYDAVRQAQKTMPDSEYDKRVYHVAIDIVSLSNRGQWLMFEAILEQVRGRLPNAVVYVDQKAYRHFASHFKRRGVLPLLDPSVIDLLLYAPGFKFSDTFAWTEDQVRSDRDYLASFDKPGRKIVFLPQAFGPFSRPETLKHLQNVLVTADLVFSREATSLGYLKSAIGDDARFQRAPDFTCIYHDGRMGNPLSLAKREYFVVVPNVQMLKKSDAAGAEAYRGFMVALLRRLLETKLPVVLLNHSGSNDAELIFGLNEAVGGHCRIAEDLDAGACKRVLSEARLVVSSRYHAMVSALTEGVPALCTSWSHKYQDLLDELGCPAQVLDVRDADKALAVVEAALRKPETCRADPVRVELVRAAVYGMWRKVFALTPDWAARSRPIDGKVLANLNGCAELEEKILKLKRKVSGLKLRCKDLKTKLAKRDRLKLFLRRIIGAYT